MKEYILSIILICLISYNLKAQTITFIKTYGDTSDNVGIDIKQTFDGGYILIGKTYINYPHTHPLDTSFLLKLNQNGDTSWVKKFPAIQFGSFKAIVQTIDRGYAITGQSTNNFVILKTNIVGDTLWTVYKPDSVSYDGTNFR